MKKKNRAKICGYRTPSDFIRRRVRELKKMRYIGNISKTGKTKISKKP